MTAIADLSLDPVILLWLQRIREISQRLPDLAGPPSARRRAAALQLSDALAREFTMPVPVDVAIDEVRIPGPAGPMRLRRFRPAGLEAKAPTQLFLHGGGFHGGTIDEILNDRLCAHRARDAGIQIASLEYRLAPEHRFPAAVEDAVAALGALHSDTALGADPARIGIGGNSAGAAIAASTALRLADAEGLRPIHQDLEVLPATLTPVGASAQEFSEGFGLDDAAELGELYTGPGPVPPLAVPLDAPDLTGLPPALVHVAEFDPLRDSGIAYAERLREAGIRTTLLLGIGHLHATCGLTARLPAARAWQEEHAQALGVAYRGG